MKKIVYVDMDGVLVDIEKIVKNIYGEDVDIGNVLDENASLFYHAEPIKDAVQSFKTLSTDPRFDVYILSTAPWANPESLKAKRIWIEKHLGKHAERRLILTHHKNLLKGDYLIDDRIKNGVLGFEGNHIFFGHGLFKTWGGVIDYLDAVNL